MRRALRRTSSSGDDTSSSGDEGRGTLSASRYSALELHSALSTWEHNARATRELQSLFQKGYKDADKAAQAAMYQDLGMALIQAERMGRMGRSLDALLAVALKALPKQKRNAIQTAHKQAAVRQRRTARKGEAAAGCREPDDDGGDGLEDGPDPMPSLHDLPLEVVERIFECMGPVELGRCACVCRCWRDLSRGAEHTWQRLLSVTFAGHRQQPKRAAAAGVASQGGATAKSAVQRFGEAVQARPQALLRWSGRALEAGKPVWLSGGPLSGGHGGPRRSCVRYPTAEQVVLWALRRPLGDTSSSSGSGEESDGSPGDALRVGRLWAASH